MVFRARSSGYVSRRAIATEPAVLFALVSIGLCSLLLATIENRHNTRALGAQHAGKQRSLAVIVGALLSILGVVALVAMIFRQ